MLSSSCKNTLFFVSTKCVRIQPRPSLRNGTVRSAKSNRSELFIAAFGRKTRGGGHGGTSDRKIPYLRHTPRAHRRTRPACTCILAVGSIPGGDKTPTSIWCACKNKGSNESRYPTRYPSPRTIACPVITRIDLVATSIYIEKAMPRGGRRREKSASVREQTENGYRCRSEDTRTLIERPPRCRSVRWFRGVCGYCDYYSEWTTTSARCLPIYRSLVCSLSNSYLKYRVNSALMSI